MGVHICRDCGGDISDQIESCPHCGAPSVPIAKGGGLPVAVTVLIGLFVCTGLFGIGAAIAIPNFMSMGWRAKRAEVPANVDGLRTAQRAYDAAFDAYVEIPTPVPRPISELGPEAVDWPWETGFDTLGWAPDGQVRGTYWVTTTPDGFEVHGMIDIDGDGVPAHYMATESEKTRMLTPNSVY